MKFHPDHYENKTSFRSTPTFQSNNLTNNLHYLQFHQGKNSNVYYKPTVQINPFNYRQRQSKLQHLSKMINFQLTKNKFTSEKDKASIANKKNQLHLDIKQEAFPRSILSNSAQLNLKTNLSSITSAKLTQSQIYLKQQKRYNIISNLPQPNNKQFCPFPKFTKQCPNTKFLCK